MVRFQQEVHFQDRKRLQRKHSHDAGSAQWEVRWKELYELHDLECGNWYYELDHTSDCLALHINLVIVTFRPGVKSRTKREGVEPRYWPRSLMRAIGGWCRSGRSRPPICTIRLPVLNNKEYFYVDALGALSHQRCGFAAGLLKSHIRAYCACETNNSCITMLIAEISWSNRTAPIDERRSGLLHDDADLFRTNYTEPNELRAECDSEVFLVAEQWCYYLSSRWREPRINLKEVTGAWIPCSCSVRAASV